MKKLIVLFLIIICSKSYGQELPNFYIKKFFNTYQKNTDKAIDDIYQTNPWTSGMGDAITEMKKTIRNYGVELGKYYGYEFITEKSCTSRFIVYAYLLRYDRQPIKVYFTFYEPDNEWMLYSLTFNSDVDEDLETAVKFDIQNPQK